MASPIIFRIQDGVDPQIAQNVAAIGNAARTADASVQALTQALQAINNSGVQGLSSQLSAASTSTTRLSNTTAKMGAAALTASQQVDKLVTSYTDLNHIISVSITTLGTYSAVLRTVNAGSVGFTQSISNAGKGTSGATGNFIAASAALNGMELKIGSNTRAAGRFLTSVLGLGPLLRAAFPIFGAVALIGVLDIAIEHVSKISLALKNLSIDANKATLDLLKTEQILIKGEKGSFSAGVANFLNARPALDNTTLPDPSITIQRIHSELALSNAIAQVNEAGKQGMELQRAKEASIHIEISNTQLAIDKTQKLRDAVQALLEAKINTGILQEKLDAQGNRMKDASGRLMFEPVQNLRFAEDSEPQKELIRIAKEYDSSLRSLQNTLVDLNKVKLPTVLNKDALAAAKDEAKAAAKQLVQFTEDLNQLKTHQNIFGGGDRTTTALQQQLDLLNSQVATALPQNLDNLHARIATVTAEMANQKNVIEALFDKYKDQVSETGLYSDALKAQADFDKAILSLQKNKITLTDQEKQSLKDLIVQAVESQHIQNALKQLYTQFDAPLRDYIVKQNAIQQLEKQGTISRGQAVQALNEANKAYIDATQPLAEYAHGLQNQIDLFGKYDIALTVATELQRVHDQLRQKGIVLTDKENEELKQLLTNIELQKQVQTSETQLYEKNQGAVQKLTISILALQKAKADQIITDKQYHTQLVQLAVDLANLNIAMGKFKASDVLTSTFGQFIKDFQGMSVGIVKTWQNAFDTIANGAANAFGRAIAYGEDLGKALQDVARQALSELISGFIKLGIQWIITSIIGKTVGQSAADIAIAQGAAVAAAWAPAAAFVSLASFGANAGPADLALGSTVAFAQLLGALKFNQGGIVPGYGNHDSIPALLTPGEAILTQAATRFLGVSTIQAWNKGQYAASPSGRPGSGSASQSLTLNLIHDKNAVDVVQINENTIRVIAKQEARSAVATHTPSVVAGEVANPSSQTRKALALHTNVRGAHS